MSDSSDPKAPPPELDNDMTGSAQAQSERRRNMRERMGDFGLIAVMALVTIVAVGAVLGWALYSGNDGDGGGSGSGSGSHELTTETIDVSAGEFWFKPSSIEVAPNTKLVINVTNDGTMTHDLKIGDTETGDIAPGDTVTLETKPIMASEQGYCTLPGHRSAGMVFDVIVNGGDGGDDQAAAGANTGVGKGINPDDVVLDPNAEPPADFVARDPNIAPAPGGTTHNMTIEARDVEMELAPGVKQLMWVFSEPGGPETVPGPTIRGKVGDVFNVKIVNRGTIEHSMDFHASEIAPNVAMRSLKPGESLMYTFSPRHSGVWMYHCGTPPVLHHIANGMYGTVIIDPADGLDEVDHEFAMVQSEYYFGPEGQESDYQKALWGFQDAVVFNGYYNQYIYDPIKVKSGDRIRIFVNNIGPNEVSAFHIVGTQFDTMFKEGAYRLQQGNAQAGGAQALDLLPSQGGFVEFTIPEPGTYTMVSHKFNDASRGAAGLIIAE